MPLVRARFPLGFGLLLLILPGSLPAGAQQIKIFGNGVSIASGDSTPSPHDHTYFGSVDVGPGGVIDREFTIRNTGDSPLRILGFERLGPQWFEFAVPITPALLIPPGGGTTMVVRFIPTRGGLRNATLRLTTNAANEQVFEFAVAGEGDIPDPEINVQGNGLDIMDGDPVPSLEDHTDFGSIDVNDGGVTRTFTIQNTGELTLEVAGVQLIGGDNDQFALVSPPASRVFPAQETTFDIEFDPDRTGTHLTTIRITNSDLGKATYDFVIRGTATTAKPQLTLIGNEQPIAPGDDTPATRDGTRFPSTDVGATATHSFTIVNSGAAPLSIANIVFLGSHAADFSASGVPASAIAPAAAATFQVTFNPSSLGPRTATLRINSNDPDFPAYRLDLLGTGGNFKLIRIEKDDRDAIVHFLSNPDTDVSTYIYTIRHSTNLSTWTTVGSLLSPGARAEQFRHLDGYLERTGYWHILETVIPLNE